MANQNKKDLQEVNRLLGEIQKAYDKLGDKNPFRGMDTSKISDFDTEISKLETALDGVESKVRRIDTSFGDLKDTLKAVVNEFNPKALKATNLLERGMKGLVTEARKMANEEEDIGSLSRDNLVKILERTKASQKLAKGNAKSLLEEKGLIDATGKVKEGFEKKIIKLNEKEQDQLKTAKSILEDENNLQKDLINGIKDRIDLEDEFNKKLGFGGQLVKGLDKALQKAGFPALGIAEAIEKTRKGFLQANAEGEKFSVTSSLISNIGEKIKDSFTTANILQAGLIALVDAVISLDKSSGELAKNLGISYQESIGLSKEASSTARDMDDILVSSKDILKAQSSLQEHFQMGAKFSMEMAADFASIQKRTGLSDKAMGLFARTAMQSNTTIKDNLKDINKTVLEQNKQNKTAFTFKEIQEAVGNTSARTRLIFKGNVGEIAKAVIETKKLGVSMEQLNSIADSLLQFESSIAAELEAELITGRQLNLEQARSAALRNDMVSLAQELKKQNIDAASFGAMNRIAQEATAKALGMSVDGMAEMLDNQQKLNTFQDAFGKKVDNISDAQTEYNKLRAEGLSAEEAANKIGDKSLANQLESASQAEKLAGIMARVQEIFIGLAGPVLRVVSPIVDLLIPALNSIVFILEPILVMFEGISKILTGSFETLTGWETVLGAIGLAAGSYYVITNAIALRKANMLEMDAAMLYLEQSKKAGILSTIGAMTIQLGIQLGLLKASLATNAALTFGVGVAVAVAATLAGLAALRSSTADDMIDSPPGYGKRTLLMPEGAIALNDEDTIIAGTNLGGKGKKESPIPTLNLNPVINVLKEQNIILNKILDKNTDVHMDGNKVGTQLALSNPRMQ